MSYKKAKTVYPEFSTAQGESKAQLKCLDSSVTFERTNTNIIYHLLNPALTGVNVWNRIGRRISMVKLCLRAMWHGISGSNDPDPDALRWAIIYDRQPNNTFPLKEDLFQDIDRDGNVSTTALSWPNIYNDERFLFLVDEVMILPLDNLDFRGPGLITDTNGPKFNVYKEIDLQRLISIYSQDTLEPDEDPIHLLTTGSLFVAVYSNDDPGNFFYKMEIDARLRFYDN